MSEVLPELQQKLVTTQKEGRLKVVTTRGKPKALTKTTTTIRLDNDILEYFRAGGKGWQTRINSALREYTHL